MTSEQIMQIYKTRMQAILNKIDKDKQDQLDKERDAQIKHDKFWNDMNVAGTVANMGKDLFEWRQGKLLEITYDDPETFSWGEKKRLKYKPKEARPFMEVLKDPIESAKRLTPIGTMEETEGFKEFKETADVSALDEALANLEAGTIDGEIPTLQEGGTLTASTDWMPMEVPEVAEEIPLEAPTVPDAKPGLFETGQTILQLTNIGNTIADEDATSEEKGVASVQGAKLLTDLATKRAGQETVSKIGSKAFSDVLAKKGLKEGVKLTGKQAVGTILGGALGAHTMVTEAGEAKESLKEKDYDEAILHGMASGSGALQTGGATMMASGIGAPLGAVLYGIGTAGSVISSAGLFLEGLFGDKKEEKEEKKPKFDAKKYLDSIRSERRYF
jgi:hypothetical protein